MIYSFVNSKLDKNLKSFYANKTFETLNIGKQNALYQFVVF